MRSGRDATGRIRTPQSGLPSAQAAGETGAAAASEDGTDPGELYNPCPVGTPVELNGWQLTVGPVLRDQADALEAIGDPNALQVLDGHEVIAFDATGVRTAKIGEPSFTPSIAVRMDEDLCPCRA